MFSAWSVLKKWTRKSWCTSSAKAAKCSESETQFVLLSKLLQDTYQLRQPQWLLPLLTNILYIGISTLLLTSIIKSPNSTHFQHPSHLPLSNANINLVTAEYVTAPGQYMRTRLTTNCIPHDYWRKKKNAFQFSCVPHFWHIRLRCDALLLLNTFTPILLFLFAMTVLPFSSSHYKSHMIEKKKWNNSNSTSFVVCELRNCWTIKLTWNTSLQKTSGSLPSVSYPHLPFLITDSDMQSKLHLALLWVIKYLLRFFIPHAGRWHNTHVDSNILLGSWHWTHLAPFLH